MGPNGPDDRSSQPRYALLASRWVRLAWPEIAARNTVVPARVVTAANLEQRARRRRRVAARFAIAACGSLAAAAAGIVGWTWVDHRQPVASGGGLSAQAGFSAPAVSPDEALWVRLGAASTATAREVVPGDIFRATTGSGTAGVRLASSDGTELVVEPGGALRVVEAAATKRFTLLLGAVRVHVRKLRSGERFLIDTPEAEVEVHGTRFRVTRADAATGAASGAAKGAATGLGPSRCGGAASTVVSVSEGVVSVAGAEVRVATP
jgi:ferric-dicitrate binding protein FerR (iron transport regulator)